MPTKTSPSSTAPSAYGEASIRVLKGLEPVKQRPGMYTRTDNPLHIVQEVIDNAADEALARHGRRIGVTLHAGEVVTTGTCVVPIAVEAGDEVRARFGPLGGVSVRFA